MAEQQKYNVVYAGAIAEGFDQELVKRGFVSQMKIPADKVDQLLSGKRMTLKKSVSKSKAELWQKKLLSIGAETAIVPLVEPEVAAKKLPPKSVKSVKPPVAKQQNHAVSNQEEYDEELEARIRKAKAMIAAQQMEDELGKSKETSPFQKLLVFSVAMGVLIYFLYFYLDSMI